MFNAVMQVSDSLLKGLWCTQQSDCKHGTFLLHLSVHCMFSKLHLLGLLTKKKFLPLQSTVRRIQLCLMHHQQNCLIHFGYRIIIDPDDLWGRKGVFSSHTNLTLLELVIRKQKVGRLKWANLVWKSLMGSKNVPEGCHFYSSSSDLNCILTFKTQGEGDQANRMSKGNWTDRHPACKQVQHSTIYPLQIV